MLILARPDPGKTPMPMSIRSLVLVTMLLSTAARADDLAVVGDVEGQPLAANADRLSQALQFLGFPLSEGLAKSLANAVRMRDAPQIQKTLDPLVLLQVSINPESRVKVARGPAPAVIQQAGFTPILVK